MSDEVKARDWARHASPVQETFGHKLKPGEEKVIVTKKPGLILANYAQEKQT
jgi:hypothetical protein